MNTEQQARELWCPLVRFSNDDGGTYNRGRIEPLNDHPHNDGSLCNCIASKCAMWRWVAPPVHACDEKPEFGYMTRGYCGLAGKPGSTA